MTSQTAQYIVAKLHEASHPFLRCECGNEIPSQWPYSICPQCFEDDTENLLMLEDYT